MTVDTRTSLASLVEKLKISAKTLRLDACFEYHILGRRGHIYRDGDSYLLYLPCGGSARAWGSAKKRLSRFRIVQDGDCEGCIRLDGITEEDAPLIRELAGLRLAKSPAAADRLKQWRRG